MATELEQFDSEFNDDLKSFGFTSQSTPAASLTTQPVQELEQFDREFGSMQNRPPSEISAVPKFGVQQAEGRRDAEGNLIPIDFKSGLPRDDYRRIAALRDPQDQMAVLKEMYPDRNVRMLESGDVTLEVIDSKTKKPKDVVLNPSGLDSHDLIDLATQAPEIAAGIAAAIATRGTGFLKTTAQIISSSLAAGAAGAAKDATMRGMAGLPIRPGEIAEERGKGVLLDMFLQGGIGIGTKLGSKMVSPYARTVRPGSLEFNLEKGRKYFKDKFNENIVLTPADKTGSVALSAIEATESKMPGSRNVFSNLRRKNEATLQRIQDKAIGVIKPDEDIGIEALELLQRKVTNPMDEALTRAIDAAREIGDKRVIDMIDRAVGLPKGTAPVTPTMAGVKTLEEFDAKLAAAKTAVDEAYAKVKALPGGSGDILSGNAAVKAAQDIEKELPSVLKEVEKETGLLDEFGNPLTVTTEEKSLLKSGVPDGLLTFLNDLKSLKNGRVSLDTLTKMKNAAYDEIAKTEAVPGVKDRWFKQVAAAYEKTIQSGIDEIGDPALKAALTNAKETYKRELLPFDRPRIREMAKGEFDTARLTPEQVTERLFHGSNAIENYRLLKETLGASSPSLRTLKRSFADSIIDNAKTPVLDTIDPDKLLTAMKGLKPEIAQEVFGKNYDGIIGTLKLNKSLKNIGDLDESTINTLINLPNPSASDFKMVLDVAKRRNEAYSNSLLRDISDGVPISSKIKPTEFITRIRSASTPTKDVKEILDVIKSENPALLEAIKNLQLYSLLNKASISEAATASKAMQGQPVNISANKLREAIGSPKTPEGIRNRLLLGDDGSREEFIENMINVVAPREARDTVFSAAGGIGAGMETMKAMTAPFKYAAGWAQKTFISTAYLMKLGPMLTNQVMTPERAAVLGNTLIASEPFIARLVDTLGEAGAESAIIDLKESLDKYVAEIVDSPESRKQTATQDILEGKKTPMKLESK